MAETGSESAQGYLLSKEMDFTQRVLGLVGVSRRFLRPYPRFLGKHAIAHSLHLLRLQGRQGRGCVRASLTPSDLGSGQQNPRSRQRLQEENT